MFGKKRVEALVEGAGPSGMIAALVLAQNGVDACLVDAASGPCSRTNAAILHPATIALFDRLGFADRILAQGYRIEKIALLEGAAPRATLRFDALREPFRFALALPQSVLEATLEDELEQAGAPAHWDHRLSDARASADDIDLDVDRYSERNIGYAVAHQERVIERTLHYHAKILIAADGHNSLSRHLFNVEREPSGSAEYYAFFEIETDQEPERTMRLSFQDGLATCEIPLGHGRAQLAFQYGDVTLPHEYRQKERELVQEGFDDHELLDDACFQRLVETRAPWLAGHVRRVAWRALAPFEKSRLANPRCGPAYFLGDAARTFGPLGAASLNLGVLEAEALALRVKRGIDEGALDQGLDELSGAQAEAWSAPGRAAAEGADAFVGANCDRILEALPATGDALSQLAGQISLRVEPSKQHA